jgi:hypothetical protein
MTKLTLAAAAVIFGSTLAGSAMALPAAKLAIGNHQSIQDARWVCGPYGCRWRHYGYYGYYPRHHYYAYYPRWHRYRHWY